MKTMYPVYKKIKMLMPHCPKCGNMLSGNGSIVTPYECKCGIWDYSYLDSGYTINKRKKLQHK